MWKFLVLLTALVPLWLAYTVKNRLDQFSQPCVNDPAITIPSPFSLYIIKNDNNDESISNMMMSVEPCRCFATTYEEARDRFRQAAQRLPGTQLHALPVVVSTTTTKEAETIDIAVIPGDLPGLVIHSSGTHGVEGYAGSAIQIAFMDLLHTATTAAKQNVGENHATATVTTPPPPPPLPTIVFLHAINPWAMKRFRRTNENNVDLNRNALTPEQWKKAPHHVNHDMYANFEGFFNPTAPPTHIWTHVGVWLRGLTLVMTHGLPALKAAMTGAQYYNPRGVFFGGSSGQLEPSWRMLEEWLTSFLAERRATSNTTTTVAAERGLVTWIDVHTGLGDLGVDTFLFDPKAYDSADKLRDIVEDISRHFPDTHTPFSGLSQHAADVMQGYEETMGFSTTYFLKLFDANEEKPLLGAQEFGTVNNALVAHALITENAARQHLSTPDALTWAKATTKRAFYPESMEWRRQVLMRGLRVLRQSIRRSSSTATTISSS